MLLCHSQCPLTQYMVYTTRILCVSQGYLPTFLALYVLAVFFLSKNEDINVSTYIM